AARAFASPLRWRLSAPPRARFWEGFLATTTALMIGSLWIWPHWVREWIAVPRGYRSHARPALVNLVLGSTFPKYTAVIVIALVLIVSLVLMWKARQFDQRTAKFWFVLSLLLALTTITLL